MLVACNGEAPAAGPSSTPVPESQEPTMTAVLATRTPRPTSTAEPAPSATAAATLDPTRVASVVEGGETLLGDREVEPLCMRWEDADDDGEPEWVGLYLRPAEPPRLEGFVLDGEAWHTLAAPSEDEGGLGTYATCELEVSDVNTDGKTELLIWGHTVDGIDLLHIFVWDETGYDLLASARGDAGVDVEQIDGDLAREIVARYDAGDGLAWEQVHTWDGTHYGWTWERYAWLYADHPHAYPTHSPVRVVISFYMALDDRDLPAAYALMTPGGDRSPSYERWAAGFDTMLAVEIGSVHEIGRTGDAATVTALVRSYDNLDGYVVGRLWDVTWSAVRTHGTWRLEGQARNEELDRWEAVYYP
jgi:hypothetical protein